MIPHTEIIFITITEWHKYSNVHYRMFKFQDVITRLIERKYLITKIFAHKEYFDKLEDLNANHQIYMDQIGISYDSKP